MIRTIFLFTSLFLFLNIKSIAALLHNHQDIDSCQSKNTSNSMIHYEKVEEDEGRFVRYAAFVKNDNCAAMEPLSVEEWARFLSGTNDSSNTKTNTNSNVSISSHLASEFTEIMTKEPYDAFFFETKGVSSRSASKQFEFVLVNAPELHRFCESNGPDLYSFEKQLSTPTTLQSQNTNNSYGCTFKNLSGDAELVVPKWDLKLSNQIPRSAYSNLAVFLKQAPKDQTAAIWKMVATLYLAAITSENTTWLSTSGMGVSYLHFRLDTRPKYYTFREFAMEK